MTIEEIDFGCRTLMNAFKHRLRVENPTGKYTSGIGISAEEQLVYRSALREIKSEPWYPMTDFAGDLCPQPTSNPKVFVWASAKKKRRRGQVCRILSMSSRREG